MQGQLVVMETDQRPWISVDTKLAGPLVYRMKEGRPIGADIKLKFSLQNTGSHSPAIGTQVLPIMVPNIPDRFDPLEGQRRMCQQPFAPVEQKNPIGFAVFPNAKFDFDWTVSMTEEDFARRFVVLNGRPIVDSVAPIIGGCFDYAFPQGGKHHQTGFVFFLTQPNGEVLHPSKGDVPIEGLKMDPWFQGFYAD
jgi:hypothetical protein